MNGSLFFIVSILVGSVAYIVLNPQQITTFLTIAIIALGFVAIMTLLPRYRRRLVKRVLEQQTKMEQRGGWLCRLRKPALTVVVLNIVIFPIAAVLLPSQYLPFFVGTFLIVYLTAGAVLIVGILRNAGKLGYLLLAVSIGVSIIAVLVYHFSRMV